jgi:hypothetical protein
MARALSRGAFEMSIAADESVMPQDAAAWQHRAVVGILQSSSPPSWLGELWSSEWCSRSPWVGAFVCPRCASAALAWGSFPCVAHARSAASTLRLRIRVHARIPESRRSITLECSQVRSGRDGGIRPDCREPAGRCDEGKRPAGTTKPVLPEHPATPPSSGGVGHSLTPSDCRHPRPTDRCANDLFCT